MFDSFMDDVEMINPGEIATVIITFNKKQVLELEDSFVIRESRLTV